MSILMIIEAKSERTCVQKGPFKLPLSATVHHEHNVRYIILRLSEIKSGIGLSRNVDLQNSA